MAFRFDKRIRWQNRKSDKQGWINSQWEEEEEEADRGHWIGLMWDLILGLIINRLILKSSSFWEDKAKRSWKSHSHILYFYSPSVGWGCFWGRTQSKNTFAECIPECGRPTSRYNGHGNGGAWILTNDGLKLNFKEVINLFQGEGLSDRLEKLQS